MDWELATDLMHKADWGAVPDWAEAAGTGGALLIGAIAYRHDVATRRTAQAKLVYVTVSIRRRVRAGESLLNDGSVGKAYARAPKGLNEAIGASWEEERIGVRMDYAVLDVEVAVHNQSNESIGPILVRVASGPVETTAWASSIPCALPGQTISQRLAYNWTNPPTVPECQMEVAFRDSAGEWWKRLGIEPVKGVGRRDAAKLSQIRFHED